MDAAAEWLTYCESRAPSSRHPQLSPALATDPDFRRRLFSLAGVIFSLFTVVELGGGFLISWIPLYSILKLGFLMWLLLLRFKGASKLYQTLVQPLIRKHEAKIDQGITQGYETALSFQQKGMAAISQRLGNSGQRMN